MISPIIAANINDQSSRFQLRQGYLLRGLKPYVLIEATNNLDSATPGCLLGRRSTIFYFRLFQRLIGPGKDSKSRPLRVPSCSLSLVNVGGS